ncbi:hypothetical protein Pcinc_041286 [Petrolisthes cinctipes]|uniref:Uncharacterized protein n=1 Tax=Petrolisthes cinctipes TaxID=88211 RepID=A0AAE1EJZ1_PETCI|nr:hypothetical protein Pcinc_041286 [Petrolisthes cinctipes]
MGRGENSLAHHTHGWLGVGEVKEKQSGGSEGAEGEWWRRMYSVEGGVVVVGGGGGSEGEEGEWWRRMYILCGRRGSSSSSSCCCSGGGDSKNDVMEAEDRGGVYLVGKYDAELVKGV